MKFILISLSFLATSFLLVDCKHPKFAADNLPEKKISWGTGGGFVGKESGHILLENGQIFNRDVMGKLTEAPKTKGKKAKALFKTMETLGLSAMDFNHPGNMYSFLEFQDGDAVSRAVWGDKNVPVGKPVEDFYRALNELLQKK